MQSRSPASIRRPLHRTLIVAIAVSLAACASPPAPDTVMPGYPPGRTYSEAEALAALDAVESLRGRWQARWSAATARCHGRFLASDCVERVDAERRVVSDELDRVALEATRALREHAAIDRNVEEARRRDGAGSAPADPAAGRSTGERALRGIAERPAGD